MAWVKPREGKWIERSEERPSRRGVEKDDSGIDEVYTVDEVARLVKVTRQTLVKWAECGVIPRDGWFRIPGTPHIRIKKRAVLSLLGEK